MITELNAEERDQLLSVLRELDTSLPSEKRREPRREVLVNMWVRKIRGVGAKVALFQGRVVNISTQGVAMLVKRELTPGDKLVLPLRFREGGGWLVLCEVKNCQKGRGDVFRVGVEFRDRVEDPLEDARIPMDWVL